MRPEVNLNRVSESTGGSMDALAESLPERRSASLPRRPPRSRNQGNMASTTTSPTETSRHGIQPQVGTFLVGNEDLGTILESGDPRSLGLIMVAGQQEVDPLLALCSILGTHPINPMAIAQSMFEWMARDIEKMVRGLSLAKLTRGLKSISIVYGCLGEIRKRFRGE